MEQIVELAKGPHAHGKMKFKLFTEQRQLWTAEMRRKVMSLFDEEAA